MIDKVFGMLQMLCKTDTNSAQSVQESSRGMPKASVGEFFVLQDLSLYCRMALGGRLSSAVIGGSENVEGSQSRTRSRNHSRNGNTLLVCKNEPQEQVCAPIRLSIEWHHLNRYAEARPLEGIRSGEENESVLTSGSEMRGISDRYLRKFKLPPYLSVSRDIPAVDYLLRHKLGALRENDCVHSCGGFCQEDNPGGGHLMVWLYCFIPANH